MTEAIKEYFTKPHRQIYYPFDLGPSQFIAAGRKCSRLDFHILNNNDHKLAVSFYQGLQDKQENCLIYLHTHNGSKLEALPLAESILALGVNYCIFDFAGYGNSEGKSVSLGCREIWDIETVINHLNKNFNQQKFILWGRSMGAVAALLYLSTKTAPTVSQEQIDSKISKQLLVIGGIYDSPFQSLQKLTFEIGSKASNLPNFLLSPLVYYLKTSLKDEINFESLQLSEKMKFIKVPGVFLTSHQDSFVHYSHSQALYKEYAGKKELLYIERDHNQIRKEQDLGPVFEFIRHLNQEHPKRWQSVLANNLNYQRKFGKSIYSLHPQPSV